MADPQVGRPAGVHRAFRVLGFVVVAETVVIGALLGRSLGESARTSDAIDRVAARLQAEVQADCAFKRDVAMLAAQNPTRGPTLVQLSLDARIAYIRKGCEAAINPDTHRPYGPAPRVPAAAVR